MHVYQPITRCQNTGLLIVWFALRPELSPPGQPRPYSEMLAPEICDDFDELQRSAKLLSQQMTLSEADALKGFLGRHTSLTVDELKPTTCPLSRAPAGDLWEELEDCEAINLDDHASYDLPWTVRGRIIEPRQKTRAPSRGKEVFTMVLLLFSLMVGCASAPEPPNLTPPEQWTIPPYVPAEFTASADQYVRKAEELMYESEYVASCVQYRVAYESSSRRVALWRHLEGLMLWIRYQETGVGNFESVIASAEAAAEPHDVPLSPSYAEQNRRMLEAARAAQQYEELKKELGLEDDD